MGLWHFEDDKKPTSDHPFVLSLPFMAVNIKTLEASSGRLLINRKWKTSDNGGH